VVINTPDTAQGMTYTKPMATRFVRRLLRTPKLRPMGVYNAIRAATPSNALLAWWSHTPQAQRNFGDALNPVLIEWITGRKPISAKQTLNIAGRPVYCVIGSILDNIAVPHLVVWGAGFKYENSQVKVSPASIEAVRGPLTRENFIRSGLDCPEVYGDPALLCPQFYQPEVTRDYRLGIVPHYVDKADPVLDQLRDHPEVKIIDVEGGVYRVIDEINRCENVVSSSLHGLIVADAYGIPSAWITISDKVLGGGFKFNDYLASVGRAEMKSLRLSRQTTPEELRRSCNGDRLQVDLAQLWRACPFRRINKELGLEALEQGGT